MSPEKAPSEYDMGLVLQQTYQTLDRTKFTHQPGDLMPALELVAKTLPPHFAVEFIETFRHASMDFTRMLEAQSTTAEEFNACSQELGMTFAGANYLMLAVNNAEGAQAEPGEADGFFTDYIDQRWPAHTEVPVIDAGQLASAISETGGYDAAVTSIKALSVDCVTKLQVIAIRIGMGNLQNFLLKSSGGFEFRCTRQEWAAFQDMVSNSHTAYHDSRDDFNRLLGADFPMAQRQRMVRNMVNGLAGAISTIQLNPVPQSVEQDSFYQLMNELSGWTAGYQSLTAAYTSAEAQAAAMEAQVHQRRREKHVADQHKVEVEVEQIRQTHAKMIAPYLLPSGKWLRKSSYKGLFAALTGHTAPGTANLAPGLDKDVASEIIGTIYGLHGVLADIERDENVRPFFEGVLLGEQSLKDRYHTTRARLPRVGAQVGPPLTKGIAERVATLTTLWPNLLPVLEAHLPQEPPRRTIGRLAVLLQLDGQKEA